MAVLDNQYYFLTYSPERMTSKQKCYEYDCGCWMGWIVLYYVPSLLEFLNYK
jgi:hypothetical protein